MGGGDLVRRAGHQKDLAAREQHAAVVIIEVGVVGVYRRHVNFRRRGRARRKPRDGLERARSVGVRGRVREVCRDAVERGARHG